MTDIFQLEALRAHHGDCLILHYGPEDDPERVLIDGGPSGTFDDFLEQRLEQLRGDEEVLRFRMLMVSHIDADHIVGVIDLMQSLKSAKDRNLPIPYRFRTLWHNSFDDAIGGGDAADAAVRETSLAVGAVAGLDPEAIPRDLPVDDHSALALASVNQGRTLRLLAEELGVPFNKADGADPQLLLEGDTANMRHGLRFDLLGPSQQQVDALRASWKRFLDARERRRREREETEEASVELVEFVDRSVPNLASLVVWAEKDGKVMLLTGDARGDFILEALEATGKLPADGDLEVDLLKMPHHGSVRNVADVFFQRLRARHYVFSADGRHGNPDPPTFELLLANRRPEHGAFTIHLTYPLSELIDDYPAQRAVDIFAAARQRGLDFEVITSQPGDLSLTISL